MEVLAQRLIAVVGPTASGKTALAIDLARRLQSDIVSVDSRQVYQGLDLGSGKDRPLYRQGGSEVAVHLIDVAQASETYSLFRYQEAAYATISEWRANHGPKHPLILCGGTGLYLEAVLRRYEIANVPENIELRQSLMVREHQELWKELQELDPEWADRTDYTSKKRVVRALEVAKQRQEMVIELSQSPAWDFDPLVAVVQVSRLKLHARIAQRLEERLQAGLIEEVAGLQEQGITLERLQHLGLEYREVGEYLAGYRNRDEMTARLQKAIEELAKRQVTWFRGSTKRGVNALFLPEDAGLEEIWLLIAKRWPDLVPSLKAEFTDLPRYAGAVVQGG